MLKLNIAAPNSVPRGLSVTPLSEIGKISILLDNLMGFSLVLIRRHQFFNKSYKVLLIT